MAGMVSGKVATHSIARSRALERMCTITMVGTSSNSMITTVTALSASDVPTPCHSTVRSAPNDSPLPVKIAIQGAADQRPESG